MPFQGFLCHLTGEPVAPDDCLACAQAGDAHAEGQPCPFTPPIIRGLRAGNQPRNLRGYSATELLGCPRKVVLKTTVPYWIAPAKAYWAFRGRLVHSIVEAEHGQDHVIAEERCYANAQGMLLTGMPDVYYVTRQHLVDYKTTKRVPQSRKRYTCPACGAVLRENQWRARKGSHLTCAACEQTWTVNDDLRPEILPPAAYPSHIQQLNVYHWLLAQNDHPVQTAEVIYLDMAEVLRLGSSKI